MKSSNSTMYRCDCCGDYVPGRFFNHQKHLCCHCSIVIKMSTHDKSPYKDKKIDTTKADKYTEENQ